MSDTETTNDYIVEQWQGIHTRIVMSALSNYIRDAGKKIDKAHGDNLDNLIIWSNVARECREMMGPVLENAGLSREVVNGTED